MDGWMDSKRGKKLYKQKMKFSTKNERKIKKNNNKKTYK